MELVFLLGLSGLASVYEADANKIDLNDNQPSEIATPAQPELQTSGAVIAAAAMGGVEDAPLVEDEASAEEFEGEVIELASFRVEAEEPALVIDYTPGEDTWIYELAENTPEPQVTFESDAMGDAILMIDGAPVASLAGVAPHEARADDVIFVRRAAA